MMGEGNQIGVLIELILTHVFPEACPDKLGERVVQHPDTHPPKRFSDGSGKTWPDSSRQNSAARSDHRRPHDTVPGRSCLRQGTTCL